MNKYTFKLETALMYNQHLTISDGVNTYRAIAEFAPTKQKTLLVWLDDFPIPENEIDTVREELKSWLSDRNTLVIFEDGKRLR